METVEATPVKQEEEEGKDPRAFDIVFRLALETFRVDDWSLFC